MRRTKIVCTIGPASSSTAELDRLVAAGMDVARLNFSHGTHAEHAAVIRRLREGEARWGQPVTILQDLQGPKVRLLTFRAGRADLRAGAPFTLQAQPIIGDAARAAISHPEYLRTVKAGDEIWLDDGMIRLRVEATTGEEVPLIQKDVIRQARTLKVPVIIATQMLESMITHVRPTRAEVSDVATAIFDGADAIMLSAETAAGQYPTEAVEIMARIAERAERSARRPESARRRQEVLRFPEAISDAAQHAARDLQARAIVAVTQSGFSARLMSQERPDVPIIALTPLVEVQRRLGLSWGVSSRLCRKVETTDEMIEEAEAMLLADGSVRAGDTIVIISGAPMWVAGTTNLLKLHRIGERR